MFLYSYVEYFHLVHAREGHNFFQMDLKMFMPHILNTFKLYVFLKFHPCWLSNIMFHSDSLKAEHLKGCSIHLTKNGYKDIALRQHPALWGNINNPVKKSKYEHVAVCCHFLNVCKVYARPIYHSRSLLTAWKENIFITAPSIINQCRVKSEYVSEELNKVETWSGFCGSLWEYQQCRAFSAQIWAERSMTFISLLCGLCGYKACNYT